MTKISITLTTDQLVEIGAQIPTDMSGGGEPPPSNPTLMEIDFSDVWHGKQVEEPVEQYANSEIRCTDIDGYSIAIQLPDDISRSFKLRMTDVQIPQTPYGRFVVFSTRRDFNEPYLKSGNGGTSAKCDLEVTPDMSGMTVYFNGRLSTGSPTAPYQSMLQGLTY